MPYISLEINIFKLELCDNLDNKIIETVNFIVIKIMNFYYRDNSKFLDITVYFTKTNTLVPDETIINQDMHILYLRMSLVISCYCIMITIAIDVRFRFSIDNTTDHLIINKANL